MRAPARRPAAQLAAAALALIAGGGCYFFPRDTTGRADAVFTATEWELSGPAKFRTKNVPGSPHARPVFGLRNEGTVPHELRLFSLIGLTAEQRHEAVEHLRATGEAPEGTLRSGGVAAIAPGGQASSTQLASAGWYVLTCLLVDGEGRTHAQRGMLATVEVV